MVKSYVQQYLKGVPAGQRQEIKRLYRAKNNGTFPALNMDQRAVLQDCIFVVENRIESEGDGHPHDPRVVAMRAARNRVLDDLRWNEPSGRLAVESAEVVAPLAAAA